MMKNRIVSICFALVLVAGLILLSGCTLGTKPTSAPAAQSGGEQEAQSSDTPPPPSSDTPEPTPVPPTDAPALPTDTLEPLPTESPALDPLPPEPQEIEFTAEDGEVLKGRYYPGAINPGPVVVLMHWAGGDRNDWNEIAFWLQNRGLQGTSSNVGTEPWLDPSWFPPMIEGRSFGVFTFSFRGFEGGNPGTAAQLRMDALAALKKARELEGADPLLLSSLGASIGADAPVDACGPFNLEFGSGCLGALSLSPGSYLEVIYADAVKVLQDLEPPVPVWCFYAVGDTPAAHDCKSAGGDLYQTFEWSGDEHGMLLLQPEIEPSAMKLILDFLKLVYGYE